MNSFIPTDVTRGRLVEGQRGAGVMREKRRGQRTLVYYKARGRGHSRHAIRLDRGEAPCRGRKEGRTSSRQAFELFS